jgi:hypothetical protein
MNSRERMQRKREKLTKKKKKMEMRLGEPKVEKFRPLGANDVIIQASL